MELIAQYHRLLNVKPEYHILHKPYYQPSRTRYLLNNQEFETWYNEEFEVFDIDSDKKDDVKKDDKHQKHKDNKHKGGEEDNNHLVITNPNNKIIVLKLF